MVVHLEAGLGGSESGGLGQDLLQAREGGDVAHHAARRAHEVVVMGTAEVLRQLEAAQVVASGDAPGHPGVAEHGQVPVGGALGHPRRVGKDLGDGDGAARQGHRLHQGPPAGGVALADRSQAERRLQVETLDVEARLIAGDRDLGSAVP